MKTTQEGEGGRRARNFRDFIPCDPAANNKESGQDPGKKRAKGLGRKEEQVKGPPQHSRVLPKKKSNELSKTAGEERRIVKTEARNKGKRNLNWVLTCGRPLKKNGSHSSRRRQLRI